MKHIPRFIKVLILFITNALCQKINAIGKSVAATELQNLVDKKLMSRVGESRSTRYMLADR